MGADKAQVRKPKPKWIIRASHNEKAYFLMARATAQDNRLSWAARGMLSYLLSKPDDWRVSIKDLQQGCGRDKVYKLLEELIQLGYVVRSKTQSVDYYVYEIPLPENTEVENGLPENPDTEIPDQENQDAYIIQNKEQNTENTSLSEVASAPPTVTEPVAPKAVSINQVLKDAIAVHVEGIAPNEGTALTGLLANKAAAVWKRKLKVAGLTAEHYASIARSIPAFVSWFKAECENCDPPRDPTKFESWYAKFTSTNGKTKAQVIEDKYIDDPDNPGIKITRAQLAGRRRNQKIIEAEHGKAS